MKKLPKTIVISLAGLCGIASLQAQTLMLDFGPTTTTATTNSPFHTESAEFTDTTWNTLGIADSSSLFYSNGSAATGISLNLGIGSGSTINLGTQPASSSDLGIATNTGVYDGTSVGKDAIFGTTTTNPFIGAQISGLSAGTYDVYVIARNTSVGSDSSAYGQQTYAGATSDGNFDFSGFTTDILTYSDPHPAADSIAAWVAGENYSKFTITLTSGEALSIAIAGTETGQSARGFLNSVQIVSVPEPTTFAALTGILALGCVMTRRRRA